MAAAAAADLIPSVGELRLYNAGCRDGLLRLCLRTSE